MQVGHRYSPALLVEGTAAEGVEVAFVILPDVVVSDRTDRREGPESLLVGVNGRDTGLVVEKVG